jgi:crotonobetainyl-CoA:carnitine CoA-transferase CaiB-like acyl-CoA transferase
MKNRSFYFEANNRNKKGITLDLRKEKAREIVYKLIEKSDVFVQNFRKGVASKLGLDYKTLSRINPLLIYASGSSYGPEGPDSTDPCMDYTGLARSGIMFASVEPGKAPLNVMGGIADQMTGTMVAFGVLAALVARERLGIGQEVDASQLGSMSWLQGLNVASSLLLGQELPFMSREASANPLWNHYKCKDDKWICFALLQSDRHWPGFCEALGAPELKNDPRFDDMEKRMKNGPELVKVLDKIFVTRPRAEWIQSFKEQGGDFIFTVVNRVSDLADDPQALANNYIVDFDHPAIGPTKLVGFPVNFSKTPAGPQAEAPELGQHTEEILLDLCGYDWDKITELRDKEII